MEDAEEGDARLLLLLDHCNDDFAVLGVERGGRLVEKQDRVVGDEAARDVDALLLAAGEGRGGSDQSSRGRLRADSNSSARARATSRLTPRAVSGSATMSSAETRGTTRRNWLT